MSPCLRKIRNCVRYTQFVGQTAAFSGAGQGRLVPRWYTLQPAASSNGLKVELLAGAMLWTVVLPVAHGMPLQRLRS
jgi:hypothetical protein